MNSPIYNIIHLPSDARLASLITISHIKKINKLFYSVKVNTNIVVVLIELYCRQSI